MSVVLPDDARAFIERHADDECIDISAVSMLIAESEPEDEEVEALRSTGSRSRASSSLFATPPR